MQAATAPSSLSYPKERIKILLLENVHPSAVACFRDAGYTDIETHTAALSPAVLQHKLAEAHVLGIRSKTQLTAELLHASRKLLGVGAFCIGTDQVHLPTATALGIPVFNAPFSSTRSVAELVIGAAIMLMRGVHDKSLAAHQGQWHKSAKNAHELRGKTLGIVGYGRIGSSVGILAEAMNMQVIYYDVVRKLSLGGARPVNSLAALLSQSDIVSLHTPEDASTVNMLGAAELALMRRGGYLINYARGKLLDAQALAQAVHSGHLAGAAVDVFADEPRGDGDAFRNPLQQCPNTILTPHIGGSTEEAQESIGIDAAQKLIAYLDTGSTYGSLTVPELNLPQQTGAHRLLHIHHNLPGVMSELNSQLSQLGINIVGQYLKTNEHIGYVVLDIEKGKTELALDAIRSVKHTIRARSLY